jgi:hypothetical protein
MSDQIHCFDDDLDFIEINVPITFIMFKEMINDYDAPDNADVVIRFPKNPMPDSEYSFSLGGGLISSDDKKDYFLMEIEKHDEDEFDDDDES